MHAEIILSKTLPKDYGPYVICFIYAQNNQNYTIKGWCDDVIRWIDNNLFNTKYVANISMWSHGKCNSFWSGSKEIYLNKRDGKRFKKKWEISISGMKFYYKRIPHKWLREWNI